MAGSIHGERGAESVGGDTAGNRNSAKVPDDDGLRHEYQLTVKWTSDYQGRLDVLIPVLDTLHATPFRRFPGEFNVAVDGAFYGD